MAAVPTVAAPEAAVADTALAGALTGPRTVGPYTPPVDGTGDLDCTDRYGVP